MPEINCVCSTCCVTSIGTDGYYRSQHIGSYGLMNEQYYVWLYGLVGKAPV